MDKIRFSWPYYIIVRKEDGYVYTDFGKYLGFASPYSIDGGKRIKYYTSVTKMPSWVNRPNGFEIKRVMVECKEVE